ncbi:MAG: hypothetical protein ACI9TF_000351, partial [Paracrocinitomix sp.]
MRAQPCQSRSFRVCCIPHRTLAALLVLFTLLTAACSSGFQNTDVTSAFAEPAFNDASDAFEDHDSDSDEIDNFTTSNPDEAGSDGRASRLTASGAAGAEATAQLPDLGRDII